MHAVRRRPLRGLLLAKPLTLTLILSLTPALTLARAPNLA